MLGERYTLFGSAESRYLGLDGKLTSNATRYSVKFEVGAMLAKKTLTKTPSGTNPTVRKKDLTVFRNKNGRHVVRIKKRKPIDTDLVERVTVEERMGFL